MIHTPKEDTNIYKYKTPFDCIFWCRVIGTPIEIGTIEIYECIKGHSYCPGCIEFKHINE